MIITRQDFHKLYGPGRPAIPEAHLDEIVVPANEIPVLTALVDYVKAKRCLEIGCNTGATSAAILAGNKTIQEYIGVDLEKIWYTEEPPGKFALADSRFQLMQLANGSKDLHPGDIEPVDFIFIDGDHSYRWVAWDSKLSRWILSPNGGVITWHDYGHPGNQDVQRWIHEENDRNFIEDNSEPRIVWVEGTTICYQIFNAAQQAAQGVPLPPKRKSKNATKSKTASNLSTTD